MRRIRLLLSLSLPLLVPALVHAQSFGPVTIDARAPVFQSCGDITGVFQVDPPHGNRPRVLTFGSITGQASCCGDSEFGPPDGSPLFEGAEVGTDIAAFDGISGLQHDDSKMFLAGVFIDSSRPCGQPAPPDLRFTSTFGPDVVSGAAIFDLFPELSPQVNQTFFIGDGWGAAGLQQTWHVPERATGLVLGFVDGLNLGGGLGGVPRHQPPCCYGDNVGALVAVFAVEGGKKAKKECDETQPVGQQGCEEGLVCRKGQCRECEDHFECPDGLCVGGRCRDLDSECPDVPPAKQICSTTLEFSGFQFPTFEIGGLFRELVELEAYADFALRHPEPLMPLDFGFLEPSTGADCPVVGTHRNVYEIDPKDKKKKKPGHRVASILCCPCCEQTVSEEYWRCRVR